MKRRGWGRALRAQLTGPLGLALGFLLVHAIVWQLCGVTVGGTDPSGDVTGVYRFWMEYWQSTGVLVGVNTAWVYPIGALPPMLFAWLFGHDGYLLGWLVLVTALNAVAFVLLARRSRAAAWWWLLCILLLGPVGLTRVDAVALPFAVVAVLHVWRRPAVASALLAVATWIKVWPAAMIAAMLIAGRRRGAVIAAAAITSSLVLALALTAGARANVFSFIGAQATRGLQIEAPAATPWLLLGALGGPARIVFDRTILTFQVDGPGVPIAVAIMTPVLAAAVLAVVLLAVRALRSGAEPRGILAATALALVTATVVLNKVSSPQYLTWLIAPALLGVLSTRAFRLPAVLVPIACALTQLLYPVLYDQLLALQWSGLTVLVLRNALLVWLLGWAVWRIVAPGRALLAPSTPARIVRRARPGARRAERA